MKVRNFVQEQLDIICSAAKEIMEAEDAIAEAVQDDLDDFHQWIGEMTDSAWNDVAHIEVADFADDFDVSESRLNSQYLNEDEATEEDADEEVVRDN